MSSPRRRGEPPPGYRPAARAADARINPRRRSINLFLLHFCDAKRFRPAAKCSGAGRFCHPAGHAPKTGKGRANACRPSRRCRLGCGSGWAVRQGVRLRAIGSYRRPLADIAAGAICRRTMTISNPAVAAIKPLHGFPITPLPRAAAAGRTWPGRCHSART